jgi:hypothetical protein
MKMQPADEILGSIRCDDPVRHAIFINTAKQLLSTTDDGAAMAIVDDPLVGAAHSRGVPPRWLAAPASGSLYVRRSAHVQVAVDDLVSHNFGSSHILNIINGHSALNDSCWSWAAGVPATPTSPTRLCPQTTSECMARQLFISANKKSFLHLLPDARVTASVLNSNKVGCCWHTRTGGVCWQNVVGGLLAERRHSDAVPACHHSGAGGVGTPADLQIVT